MTTVAAQQVITFRVGDDHFAADIFAVERVLRYQKPTPIPNLPDWIEGVIDYQDAVVPVIDLRQRFGLPRVQPRPETRILIFMVGDDWIGAVVDAVLEVAAVAAEQLSPPPPLFRGLSAEYLRAVINREERLTVLLEISHLLTATERIALERVPADAPPRDD